MTDRSGCAKVYKGNNFNEATMRVGFAILAIAGLVLAACQTAPANNGFGRVIFKAGVRDPETQRDFDACKIASIKEIPQSINPQNGHDVNQGLRHRFIDKCLQGKGYSLLVRPYCTAGQKNPEDSYKNADAIKCAGRSFDR
ncbi:hypothetical protein [Pleomorphomonas oryzae]|uniref:hypothetical protein n=1 Tax=Pleomorphomonas oryzae TaxID=261934 RepID=UPI00047C24C4|nr:hypothetical protein [Pleomorphomonas oryzae]